MNRLILYIGNDLSEKRNYFSAMEKLSSDLNSEGYKVVKYSDKDNLLVRMFHMIYGIVKYRRRAFIVFIDTFSTTAFYYALFCSQICRFLDLPYVPILHGGNLPFRIRKNRSLTRLIFKNLLANVTPSNYLNQTLKNSGYTAKLIPNTVQVKNIVFKPRKTLKPKLLYVRSFSSEYNPTMAVEVLRELKKTYSKAELCMIGPVKDNSYEDVQSLVHSYGLQSSVEFTGVMSREEWFKKSEDFDIFINTTNIDNTPVSVIEAMALGLCVVSTNVGGIPYLIDNYEDGILVNQNDSKEMSRSIIDLISGKYPDLQKMARKKVEGFDWSVVRNYWLDLLNSVKND